MDGQPGVPDQTFIAPTCRFVLLACGRGAALARPRRGCPRRAGRAHPSSSGATAARHPRDATGPVPLRGATHRPALGEIGHRHRRGRAAGHDLAPAVHAWSWADRWSPRCSPDLTATRWRSGGARRRAPAPVHRPGHREQRRHRRRDSASRYSAPRSACGGAPPWLTSSTTSSEARLFPDLDEARLNAREALLDARLDGRATPGDADPLHELISEDPTRERPVELLMSALSGSGRHTEALAAYAASPTGSPPTSVSLPARRSRRRTGPVTRHRTRGRRVDDSTSGPAQLPLPPGHFVGSQRPGARQLDRLFANAAGPQVLMFSAVVGTAGVGKTATAIRWAYSVRDASRTGTLPQPSGLLRRSAHALGGGARRPAAGPGRAGGPHSGRAGGGSGAVPHRRRRSPAADRAGQRPRRRAGPAVAARLRGQPGAGHQP